MNVTDQECRTHDRRQDASKSNRFHACHALMRLRTRATSQIIGNQCFSVEKALRAGLSATRKLARKRGFAEIRSDVLEADFWTTITSGLPVTRQHCSPVDVDVVQRSCGMERANPHTNRVIPLDDGYDS